MPRTHVFADESGNFDFTRGRGASRYYILTTIACDSGAVGDSLLALRREMAWEGLGLNSEFHATNDAQAVRDRVFDAIDAHPFRVDATILEKSKAAPEVRESDERFYRTAWYLHLKHIARRIAGRGDELMVVSASLGTKKKRAAMHGAVDAVVRQVTPTANFRTASWAAHSEPCLQVADYCCWALQRKWETGDTRSYERIRPKIVTEFDAFAIGRKHYY